LAGDAVNLFDVELQWVEDDPEGYHAGYARIGPLVGAEQLVWKVYELPPGNSVCPYHYENGEEEWVIVLAGRATLRTPDGERELAAWETAFFPVGEEGAHKITNRTDENVRIAMWSNRADPATSVYPDSQKVGAWPPGKLWRLDDAVSYWDGETPDGLPDTRT
jgi:uncharacterized cupin superfamily protein